MSTLAFLAVVWVIVSYGVAVQCLLTTDWADIASVILPWAVCAPVTVPLTFVIEIVSYPRE